MSSRNRPLTKSSSDDTDDDDYITAFSCMYCNKIYLDPYKLVAHKRSNHSVQHAADNKRREAELKETGLKLFVSSSEEEDDSEEEEEDDSQEDETEPVPDERQIEQLPPKDRWSLPEGSSIPSGSLAYSPISLTSPLHDEDEEQEPKDPPQTTVQSAESEEEEEAESSDSPTEFPDIIVDDVLRSLHRKLARWDSSSSFGGSMHGENETGGGGSEVEENGQTKQKNPSLSELHQALAKFSATLYGQNDEQDSSGGSGSLQGEISQVDPANDGVRNNALVRNVPSTAATTATGTPTTARASLKKKLILKLKKRKTPSMRSVGWRIITGTGSPQPSFSASPQNHKTPSNIQQPTETNQLPAAAAVSTAVTVTAPSTVSSKAQYQCRICPDNKKYLDSASRDRHEVSVHCCVLTADDHDGQRHYVQEKTAAMYKCDDCGVPYRFKLMLKKHKRDCVEGKVRL